MTPYKYAILFVSILILSHLTADYFEAHNLYMWSISTIRLIGSLCGFLVGWYGMKSYLESNKEPNE